jgi:hypothetical protein
LRVRKVKRVDRERRFVLDALAPSQGGSSFRLKRKAALALYTLSPKVFASIVSPGNYHKEIISGRSTERRLITSTEGRKINLLLLL